MFSLTKQDGSLSFGIPSKKSLLVIPATPLTDCRTYRLSVRYGGWGQKVFVLFTSISLQ